MKLLFLILITLTIGFSFAQTPVEQHGRLQVSGKYVANQHNQKISLAGNSLFWSNDEWRGAPFYTAETVNHLVDEWNSSIIRIAMGVKEDWADGYLDNPEVELNKVKAVVDAAINKGIYVIIDWHSHYAHLEQAEAIGFFEEMATLYGDYDNVIYEIFNEPTYKWKVSDSEKKEQNEITWSEIKTYAEVVINAIRNIDPDNLIIVGTPHWSGGHLIGKPNRHHSIGPAEDPITIDDNVAYTLHFYAADNYHFDNFRTDAKEAMEKGIALFATEWGTVNADGKCNVHYWQTDEWMRFLKENYISHANWSISDKDERIDECGNAEGASAVKPNAGTNGLKWNDLTESGRKVRDIILNWNVPPANIGGGNPPVGGGTKFEAENATLVGVNISGNGQFVTGITDDGDKIIFNNVSVPSAGTYPLTIRYACTSDKQNYVSINGGSNENISFPQSTSFTNKTFDVNLNQGNNTITIEKHWGWFDVDYIEIGGTGNEQPEPPQPDETLKFEAENGTFIGVNTTSETSASGGQYVAGFDNDGDKVVVNANIERGGMYQLKIGYRSTSGDKKNDIYLNNTFLGNVLFPQSNSFTEVVVEDLYFEAGQNTMEFVKSWGWMDVDYFELVASTDQSGSTTNNICGRTLQISDNTTAEYYVANIINSNATVAENNATEFIGIQEINLDKEFTVEPNASFLATIEDCEN